MFNSNLVYSLDEISINTDGKAMVMFLATVSRTSISLEDELIIKNNNPNLLLGKYFRDHNVEEPTKLLVTPYGEVKIGIHLNKLKEFQLLLHIKKERYRDVTFIFSVTEKANELISKTVLELTDSEYLIV
jgi:hypothetical protein